MARYFIELSYKGTQYHGWQVQLNAHTIQQEIQNALSTVLRDSVEIVGSGRTDTGVHARVQVAHFDSEVHIDVNTLAYKLNSFLPYDIAIKHIKPVKADAHARFDATSRSYEYHITTSKNPFAKDLAYFFTAPLNLGLMNEAAACMLQHTDFESFSRVKTDVNTFNCTVFEARWEQTTDGVVFYISANRFLRGMVRAVTGTLLEVGRGNLTVEQFEKIILSKDRKKAGRALPPEGLYLTAVEYPADIYI
jgi:tRNA pseudouridine38-40 synthase